MGTISGLIGPLYYLYDLCTCNFLYQIKSLIEFSDKIILLMSIQVIFGCQQVFGVVARDFSLVLGNRIGKFGQQVFGSVADD